MTEIVSKICRICLEQQDENELFHFLNNGWMLLSKLLNFLPEIDLDFVQNPISCDRCMITIDRLHKFKKLCLHTESVIQELKHQRKSFNDVLSYVKNETEIEIIKEEFLEDKIDEYTINMAESVSKICRICLEQLGENVHFYFLNNDNSLMLLSKLLDFLPEIDIDFVQNPISCNHCTVSIEQIHEFKKLFVQTKSVVKDLQMERKSFEDMISYVKNEAGLETIKEEFEDKPLIGDNYCLQVNTDLPVCIEVSNKPMLYCYNCDYTTYNKRNLIGHVKIHQLQAREFKCDQCSYTTRNNFSLTAHKQCHFKIKPYRCDICDYNYVRKNTLKVHLRLHTEEKPYKCNVCNYRSSYKSVLKRHISAHNGEKRFKCDVCDYRCNQKSSLTCHILTHTGEKPYKCDVCDFSCIQKNTLKEHLRLHTGEKPYKCNVCDYRCNRKSNLISHSRMHTGEKPYKCDLCDYSYARKYSLTEHLRSHAGEKPYECNVCNYHCNTKSHLIRHIRTHTGEKPHKCNICDYSCVQKHSLNVHLKSHTIQNPQT